jgi:hypothetical protein
MREIIYRHRLAAIVGQRVHLAPHIDVLERDHPDWRFVAAMCLYSHAVDSGQAQSYDQATAERFAQELLMPEEALDGLDDASDTELAELFAVPLDQVAARRHDRIRVSS